MYLLVKCTRKITLSSGTRWSAWRFVVLAGATIEPLPAVAGTPDFNYLRLLAFEGLTVVEVFWTVATALALLAFFWGLAVFIFQAGDEQARGRGKQIMLWGIIALFVIIAVWGIVALLQQIFGLDPEEAGVPAPPTVEGL
jgi:hypothetical protein